MKNNISEYLMPDLSIFSQPSILKETSSGIARFSIIDDMLQRRIINCVGVIDEDNVNSMIMQVMYLHKMDPKEEITLYIDSVGGSLSAGLALLDVLIGISNPIHTVCISLAASAAALLFVAGDRRDILKRSRVMIHDPLIESAGGSALQLKDISDDLQQYRQIVAEILAEHSGKSVKEILKMTRKDTFLSAETAVKEGFADRVIEHI
jgi:ATP-dependent Clp protease protease subunit